MKIKEKGKKKEEEEPFFVFTYKRKTKFADFTPPKAC